MLEIQNDCLRLNVSEIGAEMTSVYSKKYKTDYLWDGNPDFWKFHAPICFPIIGRLKNDTADADGIPCHMTVHGFARDLPFTVTDHTRSCLKLKLCDNPDTRKMYPYHFELTVDYTLKENEIILHYEVHNTDSRTLYFSIGAHTAYRCPLDPETAFDDYYLKFEKEEKLSCINLDHGFPSALHRDLPGGKGILPLNYDLFKDDILILDRLHSKRVTLCSKKSERSVTVDYKDFPYLGIWTRSEGCPFLCIEPWAGLPDSTDSDGTLEHKKAMYKLAPGSSMNWSHTMIFQ